MNISKIQMELQKLKRAIDKQTDCQWNSFQPDFENFYYSLDSLINYIKNRDKLVINFIGDSDHKILQQSIKQIPSSKALKGIINTNHLNLEAFITHDQRAASYCLVLSENQGVDEAHFPITEKSTLRIGRHPAYSDIVIPNHCVHVDYKHAVMFSAVKNQDDRQDVKQSWFVRDLNTLTGTFLNHERVEGVVPLKPNDSITLGGEYSSPEVPELRLIDHSYDSANQLRKIVPPADIYIIFLDLKNELETNEKKIISYIEDIELGTDHCLIIVYNPIAGNADGIHAWITESINEDASSIYIDEATLTQEEQKSDDPEYQVIEDSISKYLLDQPNALNVEDQKKNSKNLRLKSIVKDIKEKKITIKLDKFIKSAKFIDDFAQSRVHEEKSSKDLLGSQSHDTQAIVKYLEDELKGYSNIIEKFKAEIKTSRSNLEKKKSNPNHLPIRVGEYIDTCTEIRTVNSDGGKQVILTGSDGADVNSFLLEYCRDTLVFGWVQQEANNLFYGNGGIGESILSLAQILRDQYGVPEEKLSDLLSIDVRIPNEDEVKAIFSEECRIISDCETYESGNVIFYLFGSLKRHAFQIMSPLILLTMLGIGNRTTMIRQMVEAVGANWIFKLLTVGLVLFLFYTLINNYLKDQRDRQQQAAAKVKDRLRSLYVDFIKESLLDPAQNFLYQELERILEEIKSCLGDIRSEYSGMNSKDERNKPEQKNSPDLSAIADSIEKIKELTQS